MRDRIARLLAVKGKRTVDSFHRELGLLMWNYCGMARNEAGLTTALGKIPALREEFWRNVLVVDGSETVNQSLEKAGRVADFLELAELPSDRINAGSHRFWRGCVGGEHRIGGKGAELQQRPLAEVVDDLHRRQFTAANAWSLRDLDRTLETRGANRLRDAHAALDAAVFAAYGWEPTISDEELLDYYERQYRRDWTL